MITLGRTISIKGELRIADDLTLEGHVEGPVFCDGSLIVGPSADVSGDVIARDITVFGRFDGQLVATDFVDICADASVSGRVVAQRFILDDAAKFNGRSEPQMLDAALRVAKFHQQKRDARAS